MYWDADRPPGRKSTPSLTDSWPGDGYGAGTPWVPGWPTTPSGVPCATSISTTLGVMARSGMNAVAPFCGGRPVSIARGVGTGGRLRLDAEQLVTGLLFEGVDALGEGVGPGRVREQVGQHEARDNRADSSPQSRYAQHVITFPCR